MPGSHEVPAEQISYGFHTADARVEPLANDENLQ